MAIKLAKNIDKRRLAFQKKIVETVQLVQIIECLKDECYVEALKSDVLTIKPYNFQILIVS